MWPGLGGEGLLETISCSFAASAGGTSRRGRRWSWSARRRAADMMLAVPQTNGRRGRVSKGKSKGKGWRRFDYDDKAATAPPPYTLVWIVETFYEDGVTLGYFDGYTMRTWSGSDDCRVTHWKPLKTPAVPKGKADG
jgi:hypothetical protein